MWINTTHFMKEIVKNVLLIAQVAILPQVEKNVTYKLIALYLNVVQTILMTHDQINTLHISQIQINQSINNLMLPHNIKNIRIQKKRKCFKRKQTLQEKEIQITPYFEELKTNSFLNIRRLQNPQFSNSKNQRFKNRKTECVKRPIDPIQTIANQQTINQNLLKSASGERTLGEIRIKSYSLTQKIQQKSKTKYDRRLGDDEEKINKINSEYNKLILNYMKQNRIKNSTIKHIFIYKPTFQIVSDTHSISSQQNEHLKSFEQKKFKKKKFKTEQQSFINQQVNEFIQSKSIKINPAFGILKQKNKILITNKILEPFTENIYSTQPNFRINRKRYRSTISNASIQPQIQFKIEGWQKQQRQDDFYNSYI